MPSIRRAESYRWTVSHAVGMTKGKPELLVFDVDFKALAQSRVSELMRKALLGELKSEEFVAEVMTGWHEMQDAEGKTWPFSVEAVRELCEIYPGMPASISKAWTDSVTGAAARKN